MTGCEYQSLFWVSFTVKREGRTNHSGLFRFLWTYCRNTQLDWAKHLILANYAQNSLPSSATGVSPLFCVLSREPPLFPWTTEHTEVPTVDYWYRCAQRMWEDTCVQISHHQINLDCRCRNISCYQWGDRVWLSSRDEQWMALFLGPFRSDRLIMSLKCFFSLPLCTSHQLFMCISSGQWSWALLISKCTSGASKAGQSWQGSCICSAEPPQLMAL